VRERPGTPSQSGSIVVPASKRKANLKPYLYILPAMVVIALIYGYPVYLNVRYSLMELTGFEGVFSGLNNYRILFSDEVFFQSLLHNLMLLALVPVLVMLCIVFAVLLFERIRGWKIYRTVVFLPTVLSITVIGITFSIIFQYNGALNELMRALGLNALVVDWIGNSSIALITVMIVILWRELGFGTILFLARLASVSEEMFDAARLDGAGWWARLWYIIIPELTIIIEFYSVVMLITMLSWVFNYIFVITSGGPGYSTYVMELYIYNSAFVHNQLGVASAAAVVLFLITLVLMIVSLRQRRRIVQEYA